MLKGVSPWVLSKNRIFYQGYFLGKLIKNSLVFDVLDRKECFLDHENEVLKKPRKWKYFKGASPWFLSKNRIFYQGCLFIKLDQEGWLYIFWREKNDF